MVARGKEIEDVLDWTDWSRDWLDWLLGTMDNMAFTMITRTQECNPLNHQSKFMITIEIPRQVMPGHSTPFYQISYWEWREPIRPGIGETISQDQRDEMLKIFSSSQDQQYGEEKEEP
ncbi:hypothetical protein EAE96_009739 [Botrytis aclada]|nr:hypothetical protein EAE96_009739 [Botrytis aclada]